MGDWMLSIDKNYFKNINTEEKAYFLGFLFADGSITYNGHRNKNQNCYSLKWKSIDKEILVLFKKAIKSGHKIREVNDQSGFPSNKKKYEIQVSCSELCRDLMKLGVVERKFNKIRIPLSLNSKLIKHFIRGYFDGDGCRYLQNSNYLRAEFYSCSKRFLTDILKYYPQGKIKTRIKGRKNILYHLTYNGTKAEKLLKELYKFAHICLKRKDFRRLKY